MMYLLFCMLLLEINYYYYYYYYYYYNMLRKYLVRKTIDNGMVILCGCRNLEIATGGMAENDSHEETDTCEERSDDIR